jgi:hypothetical protein
LTAELEGRDADGVGPDYRRLGVYDKAQLLERALAIGRPVFGLEHERVAESHDLGVLLAEKG